MTDPLRMNQKYDESDNDRGTNGLIGPPAKWLDYAYTVFMAAGLTVILYVADKFLPIPRFPVPYVLFVLLVGYLFGEGPTILAFVLGFASYDYLFTGNKYTFWPLATSPTEWGAIADFVIVTAIAGIVGISLRKSKWRIQRLADDLTDANREITSILESITDAFFTLNKDWQLNYVNPEAEHLLGKPKNQLIKSTIWEQVPELTGTIFQEQFEKAFKEQMSVQFEGQYVTLDRWYEVRVYPSPDGLSVYADDITEQKWTETALKESETKFRTIFDNAGDAIFILDFDAHFLEANKLMVERLGYSHDELLTMSIWDIDARRYEPLAAERVEMVRRQGFGVFETAHRHKNGTAIPVEIVSRVIDFRGRPGILTLARDITERKQAEEELRNSEKQLNRSQEISHVGSWELNLITNQLTWSDEVYRIFGLKPQEFGATYEAFLDAVHPDDRAAVHEAYSASIREGRDTYDIEHRVIRKHDGQIRVVQERCEHIRDESGQIVRSFGMVQDITERKQREAQLDEARTEAERRAAELESFFSSVTDGSVLFDANGKLSRVNKAAKAILGAPLDITENELQSQYRLETLDGQPLPIEKFTSHRALSGESFTGERFRIVTPWKTVAVAVSGGPVRDAQGHILGAALVWHNITDILAAEQHKDRIYEREHRIAEALQGALLIPVPQAIDGYEFESLYKAALAEAEIGGDFYDVFPIGQDNVGIVIGDVSGKGLPAAVYVSTAKHAIRALARFEALSPAVVMEHVNKGLVADMNVEGFATIFFGVLNCSEKTLTYTNAGHSPMIYWNNKKKEACSVGATGTAVGCFEESKYQEKVIRLEKGDELLLGTDGLYEIQCEGEYLEIEGLLKLYTDMKLSGNDSAAELLSRVMVMCNSMLHDDVAILRVSVLE